MTLYANRLTLILALVIAGCESAATTGLDAQASLDDAAGSTASDAAGGASDALASEPDAGAPPLDASIGAGDAAPATVDAASAAGDASAASADAAAPRPDAGALGLPRFSFFVTSLEAMQRLSGSPDGFGGDLRFGEATGLAGADKICATIAEAEMPGAAQKGWRAYLSASTGGANGGPIHAIDRIGPGPWYDRNGRLVAQNRAGLLRNRPAGDVQIANDLPNERGESQENQPGPDGATADNHDVLTGTNEQGQYAGGPSSTTCDDWTSVEPRLGRPQLGHSWPARSGTNWQRAHPAAGCAAVVNIVQNGAGPRDCFGVGCGGGYGAIYCFALVD